MMKNSESNGNEGEAISTERILEAARVQVRRFGESKTNVVDIARSLGTSHSTIYRHFRSKAEVFDAIVEELMRDEESLAAAYVDATESAADRLRDLVLALHRRKVERFSNDPEVYQLYKRVVEERPDIVQNYAAAITSLIAAILASGVAHGEFSIDDIDAAAGVVRDAAVAFVHPALVAAAAKAGVSREADLHRVMTALLTAFRDGVALHDAR
jgi:AcrR family transcriptional regulator